MLTFLKKLFKKKSFKETILEAFEEEQYLSEEDNEAIERSIAELEVPSQDNIFDYYKPVRPDVKISREGIVDPFLDNINRIFSDMRSIPNVHVCEEVRGNMCHQRKWSVFDADDLILVVTYNCGDENVIVKDYLFSVEFFPFILKEEYKRLKRKYVPRKKRVTRDV